ncbi:fimbrial protein [Pseudomonas urmiensis]|uniref:Type 1 fimbrial protein n=1 Tax=Pseudomonas urmiensis TaxID=2745493 RepID=A0A923G2G8_9PSED|nr:fimbrial protein [Pseudomonas urmiensis]MBV4535533.1 type 1 fimbrial protein [Pseudomonas urmiensis]
MSTFSKAVMVGSVLLWVGAAQATDGTVNFNGELTSSTCRVTAGTSNQTVQLDPVDIGDLRNAGDVAGTKSFNIELEFCPPGISTVGLAFEGDKINQNGRLNIAPSGSKNVELEVLAANNVQNLRSPESSANVTTVREGAGRFDFEVRYYATGQATPGDVRSSVNYILNYL